MIGKATLVFVSHQIISIKIQEVISKYFCVVTIENRFISLKFHVFCYFKSDVSNHTNSGQLVFSTISVRQTRRSTNKFEGFPLIQVNFVLSDFRNISGVRTTQLHYIAKHLFLKFEMFEFDV